MKNVSRRELLIHLSLVITGLFLLNYPAFDLTIGVFNSGLGTMWGPSITGTIINLTIFYSLAFYLIPEVLRRSGLIVFVIQLSILFFLLSFLEVIIDLTFLGGTHKSSEALSEIIITVVIFNLLFVIIAMAYRFSKDWFANEKQRISMGEWKARTELDTLKNQINPHFLFNSLNSLFSMSLSNGDDKTAEGIRKLSEMMRYVFDKANLDKVALSDEIQYIEDYIYLQKLRFEDNVYVDTHFSDDCKNIYIAPMLLIPFIENAFKYGVNATEKNKITCKLTCENKELLVYISNKIVDHIEAISSSGIGLVNVKKRLELIYPDQHNLNIYREDGLFVVKLKITI